MKLTGNLEDLGLGEILQILSFSNKSGVLRLSTALSSGLIVLDNGCIVKATSGTVKSDICESLLKGGIVTAEQIEAARQMQKEGGYSSTLGKILVDDFGVPEKSIAEASRKLIEKIVYSFFLWKEGNFVFELGAYHDVPELIRKDPVQFTLSSGLNPQFLAMEGLRLLDESRRLGAATEAQAPKDTPSEDTFFGAEADDNTPEPWNAEGEEAEVAPREETSCVNDLLKEIGDEVMIPEPGAEAVAKIPESKGLNVLKEMLEELTRPLSLNEIILLILRFSSEIINRSVVFAVKDGYIVGFGQFGIEINGEMADSRVRNMKIPLTEDSILKEAIDTKQKVVRDLDESKWNNYIVEQLGGHRPTEAFVAPILVKDRVAMLVYGDNVPTDEKLDDLSAFDIFLCQTAIAMEGIIMKNRVDKKAV